MAATEETTLQTVLAQVMSSIPVEQRNEIFARAMYEYLFKPDRDNRTPIARVFAHALDKAAEELAKELVQEPGNREKIRAVCAKALGAVLDSGELDKKLTEKLQRVATVW